SRLREDVLDAVGISTDGDGAIQPRDPQFRESVLEAYQYACCICSLKLQIGTSAFGVEAAHIKWHQAGGPPTIPNGLALCLIHHKALDRGAITLTDEFNIEVSKALHGNVSYEAFFAQFRER